MVTSVYVMSGVASEMSIFEFCLNLFEFLNFFV